MNFKCRTNNCISVNMPPVVKYTWMSCMFICQPSIRTGVGALQGWSPQAVPHLRGEWGRGGSQEGGGANSHQAHCGPLLPDLTNKDSNFPLKNLKIIIIKQFLLAREKGCFGNIFPFPHNLRELTNKAATLQQQRSPWKQITSIPKLMTSPHIPPEINYGL